MPANPKTRKPTVKELEARVKKIETELEKIKKVISCQAFLKKVLDSKIDKYLAEADKYDKEVDMFL